MLSIMGIEGYAKYGLDFCKAKIKDPYDGSFCSDETQFQCVNETVLPMIIRLRQSERLFRPPSGQTEMVCLLDFLPDSKKKTINPTHWSDFDWVVHRLSFN